MPSLKQPAWKEICRRLKPHTELLAYICIIALVIVIAVGFLRFFIHIDNENHEPEPEAVYTYKIPIIITDDNATHVTIESSRGSVLEGYDHIPIPDNRMIEIIIESDDDDFTKTIYVWLSRQLGEDTFLDLGYKEKRFHVYHKDI